MRVFFFFFLLCASSILFAQTEQTQNINYDKYFEDQFYLGISYNELMNKPSGVNRRNISVGFYGGFIKDIPLSSNRKFAIGLGLGYSFNVYNSNLQSIKNANSISYQVIPDDVSLKKNNVNLHALEVPLELRWRNSTPSEYKFLRVYPGVKFGYVFRGNSKYVSGDEKMVFQNAHINKLQYGLTLSFGYNMLNMHVYYGLNRLFKDEALLNNQSIDIKPIRVGFIFYIL